MSSANTKPNENGDGPEVEIAKIVKRSGAFDRIKKKGLEELDRMSEVQVSRDYMLNLVRINFEKQSKERKYPIPISERRAMLKNMIGGATMFDSLANSIQHSEAFKTACEELSAEIDKLIPQFFPEMILNPETKEWELPLVKDEVLEETINKFQNSVPIPGSFPFFPPPFLPFLPLPPPPFAIDPLAFNNTTTVQPQNVDNNDASDMEIDVTSSSASSPDYQRDLEPPPPAPAL
ncbi:hypothetical protein M3Y98_00363900 [Aphelenchoides besseyi]|nr:hypothetical protein M3Y98_00363900 [Aphelenchoides besseyi]KAI6201743.1 hypothetical protein M3Y96_00874800 [Aphelenchoides besseyi]